MSGISSWLKLIVKSILLIVGAAIIGWVLLLGVYLLPLDNIKSNVEKSEQYFANNNMFSWCSSATVVGMDSIVSFEAIYDGPESLIDKSLSVYRYMDEDVWPETQMVDGSYKSDKVERMSYSRYWHGYLTYVKPMYSVMTFNTFRIINEIFHLSLIIILLVIFAKRGYKELIIPFIGSYLLMGNISTSYGFQNSNVFFVTMLACIFLTVRFQWIEASKERLYIFFVMIGILIAYFDYLTYPSFSYGLPVAIYFYMHNKGKVVEWKRNFLDNLKDMIITGCFWVFGYVGMWATKWIIATIFTSENIIADAFMTINSRTGTTSGETKLVLPKVYWINMREFFTTPFVVVVGIFLIALIVLIIKNGAVQYLLDNLIFALIAAVPFAWFTLTQNHSWEHSKFTMKSYGVTSFAGLIWFISAIIIAKRKKE